MNSQSRESSRRHVQRPDVAKGRTWCGKVRDNIYATPPTSLDARVCMRCVGVMFRSRKVES